MKLRGKLLTRDFFLRDTLIVASDLLGVCLIVLHEQVLAGDFPGGAVELERERCAGAGRIVECEAYIGFSDKACHSYKANPKGRTNVMYGPGGHAYIYMIYGLYNCINAVTREEGVPEAVLIRALEPLWDEDKRKYSGPGKLCREAGITRADYGCDLCAEKPSRIIMVRPENFVSPEIVAAKRIGVDYSEEAKDFLYRFYDKNSPSVSKR